MLYSAERLGGLAIAAKDGSIGMVEDLLFDDRHWTVRWVVVATGSWLSGRSVLIPPDVVGEPDLQRRRLPVGLTRTQIEASPSSAIHLPIARAYEAELAAHYGTAPYWLSPFWLGGMPLAGFLADDLVAREQQRHALPEAAGNKPGGVMREADIHLHSIKEVTGYYIRALDDEIGHAENFLIEHGAWAIRYMVVDTRNWLPGRKVLVSPHWITAIDWSDSTIAVELTRRQIEESPDWNPDRAIDRDYEAELHRHYGKPAYWR